MLITLALPLKKSEGGCQRLNEKLWDAGGLTADYLLESLVVESLHRFGADVSF